MLCRWSFCFCAASICAGSLRAETIVLKSGEHREGQIVSETADDISLRTRFKGGNITYVDKIKRSDISRIDRGETPAEPLEAATQPAAAEPVLAAQKILDKPAFLQEAMKKYQKPDYQAAGVDLYRLIAASSVVELQRLSLIVQKEMHVTLAALAASAHFEAAMQRAAGRAVTFQPVTDYEKPFLIPMIDEEYKQTISDPVVVVHEDEEDDDAHEGKDQARRAHAAEGAKTAAAEPARAAPPGGARRAGGNRERSGRNGQRGRRGARERPDDGEEKDVEEGGKEKDAKEATGEHEGKTPASRPVLTVESWLHRTKEFDGTRLEALALVTKINRAQSLISERIRLDPQVKTDAALRDELAKDRSALTVLLKSVRARAGGALTAKEQEARDAQARNEADAAHRAEQRRQNEIMEGLQKIIGDQQAREGVPTNTGANPPAAREKSDKKEK